MVRVNRIRRTLKKINRKRRVNGSRKVTRAKRMTRLKRTKHINRSRRIKRTKRTKHNNRIKRVKKSIRRNKKTGGSSSRIDTRYQLGAPATDMGQHAKSWINVLQKNSVYRDEQHLTPMVVTNPDDWHGSINMCVMNNSGEFLRIRKVWSCTNDMIVRSRPGPQQKSCYHTDSYNSGDLEEMIINGVEVRVEGPAFNKYDQLRLHMKSNTKDLKIFTHGSSQLYDRTDSAHNAWTKNEVTDLQSLGEITDLNQITMGPYNENNTVFSHPFAGGQLHDGVGERVEIKDIPISVHVYVSPAFLTTGFAAEGEWVNTDELMYVPGSETGRAVVTANNILMFILAVLTIGTDEENDEDGLSEIADIPVFIEFSPSLITFREVVMSLGNNVEKRKIFLTNRYGFTESSLCRGEDWNHNAIEYIRRLIDTETSNKQYGISALAAAKGSKMLRKVASGRSWSATPAAASSPSAAAAASRRALTPRDATFAAPLAAGKNKLRAARSTSWVAGEIIGVENESGGGVQWGVLVLGPPECAQRDCAEMQVLFPDGQVWEVPVEHFRKGVGYVAHGGELTPEQVLKLAKLILMAMGISEGQINAAYEYQKKKFGTPFETVDAQVEWAAQHITLEALSMAEVMERAQVLEQAKTKIKAMGISEDKINAAYEYQKKKFGKPFETVDAQVEWAAQHIFNH